MYSRSRRLTPTPQTTTRPWRWARASLSGYDTVWLVVPIWHYTICTPLRMFLESTDLSGKTVYIVTTHRGSGFADVPERVQEMEPGAQVIAALAIPGNDAPKHRDEVLDYVKNNMK